MVEGLSYPVGSLGDFKQLERNETSFESLGQLLESEFKKDFLVACETGTRASYALIYQIKPDSRSQEFAEWYNQNYEMDEQFADFTSQALTSIGNKAGLGIAGSKKSIDLVVGGSQGYQAYRAFEDNAPEPEYLAKEYLRHVVADQEIHLNSIENYTLKDVISRI